MAEIRQGVNYEITADDKTAEALKSAEENAAKAGTRMAAGFSPMKAVMSALHGNFAAMGSELAKLLPQFKALGAGGAAAMTAVGAAVMSVIKFFTALKDLVKTAFNLGSLPKDIREANTALNEMKESATRFYDEMDHAREQSEKMLKRLEENADAINAMTKAQNEFNRAQEIAVAQSKEQRDEINARYDSLNSQADESTADEKTDARRKSLEDEKKRLEEELARAQSDQKKYFANAQTHNNLARENLQGGFVNWLTQGTLNTIGWFTGKKYGNEATEEHNRMSAENFSAYDDAVEKEDEIRKKLEENAHQLKMINLKKETEEIVSATNEQKELNEENARIDEQLAEEAKRNAEEIAETERRLNEELHAEKMKSILDEKTAVLASIRDEKAAEADAQARLAAAKTAVSQAWGWYRDKDAMKRQLDEEKENAEAEKQFEKDFEKLSFRRDWRTAKNLSVDQEAVRRVALAKEEEDAAQKAVIETAKASREAADSLAAIEMAITEEN